MSDKKEVEDFTQTVYWCPYCETEFPDEEYDAEQCRDACYEKAKIAREIKEQ